MLFRKHKQNPNLEQQPSTSTFNLNAGGKISRMQIKADLRRLSDLRSILQRSERDSILIFSVLRLAVNVLDIVALGAIAWMSSEAVNYVNGAQPEELSANTFFTDEVVFVLIAVAVVGLFVSKSLFAYLLRQQTAHKIAHIESRLSRRVFDIYFFRSQSGQSGSQNGGTSELQNLSLTGTHAIGVFLNARVSFLSEASLLIFIGILFLIINPLVAILAALYFGLLLAVLSRTLPGRIRRNSKIAYEGNQEALTTAADLNEIFSQALAAGKFGFWSRRFGESRASTARSVASIYSLNALPRILIESGLLVGILLFMVGIIIFSDLQTQASTIATFLAGGFRLTALLIPMQTSLNQMREGSTTANQAFMALQEGTNLPVPLETRTENLETKPPLTVELTDANYTYGEEFRLRNISVRAEPGEFIGLVGPSGGGKTSTMRLMAGLLDTNSGDCKVNGVRTRDYLFQNPGSIGFVEQNTRIISGTLAENVSLLDHAGTDLDRVKECLSRVGLEESASHIGLGSALTSGSNLQFSGGQVQRLGIARALYSNPSLLFLDEPTSSLDAKSESVIIKMIESLRGSMTVVMVAHRLSTLRKADRLYYIEAGEIRGEGSFSYLREILKEFDSAAALLGIGPLNDPKGLQ